VAGVDVGLGEIRPVSGWRYPADAAAGKGGTAPDRGHRGAVRGFVKPWSWRGWP